MSEHRWNHPSIWLEEMADDRGITLSDVMHLLEGDQIQDLFQDQMEEDGYFLPAFDADAPPVAIEDCGQCESWHRRAFDGDCRNDDERFEDPEDAARHLGRPVAPWEYNEETGEHETCGDVVTPEGVAS